MSARVPVVSFLLVLFSILASIHPAAAKNKKKQQLPDIVLNAQRVLVVIQPDAGEPLTAPMANRNARQDVENALAKWGRFNVVMDGQITDLVIAVRKGHTGGPVINNSPMDNRPVIFEPNEGNARLGGGRPDRPPDLSNPGLGPQDREPRINNQIGSSEDMFAVYLGGEEYPLDSPPIWRYTARNALNGPQVAAVEQFRKAIEESEKQRAGKP
jgi:hypothetical protein